MLYGLLRAAHVLAIVLWVGGMAFAHYVLRPAVQPLEPPLRLPLLQRALQRFLALAGAAVIVAVASGAVMIGLAHAGGGFAMPWTWSVMAAVGLLMAAVYAHVRFALYPRLARAVAAQDWPGGAAAMGRLRAWVAFNLALGVALIALVQAV